MVIVFEGHDKSGKTTIAKAYAEKCNGLYVRDEFLKQAAIENANQSYARYQLALFIDCFDKSKTIVIDRALLSHKVYSKLFNQAKSDNVIERTEELTKDKVLYIICYKRGKLSTDDIFSNQEKIRDEYLLLPKSQDIYFLDTTDEDLDFQLACIESAVRNWKDK